MRRIKYGVGVVYFLLSGCSMHETQPQALSVDHTIVEKSERKLMEIEHSLFSLPNYIEQTDLLSFLSDVLSNNPDLKSVMSTVQAAESFVNVVASQGLPQLSAGINLNRESSSIESLSSPVITKNAELSSNVSWAIDLWGKLADERHAAEFNVLQKQQGLLWSKRLLVAKAIEAWVDRWAIEKQLHNLNILKEIRRAQTLSVQERYEDGLASYQALLLQKNSESIVLTDLQRVQDEQQRVFYFLNILRGRNPVDALETQCINVTDLITPLPGEISAFILINRPDILSAYTEIQILDKETSVAHKALLPQVNLTGSVFKAGTSVQDAFAEKILWRLFGGLTQPLFNGGELRARAKRASKKAESAFWQYQHVVLQALYEVEVAVSHEKILYKNLTEIKEVLNNHEDIRDGHKHQYEQGEISVISFLESEVQFVEAENHLATEQANYLKNRVALALAIGEPLEMMTSDLK